MKRQYIYYLGISFGLLTLNSCSNSNGKADGYGNFEATEITVSAENNGKIMAFHVQEGDALKKDAFIGYIDTIPLALKREQLLVSKDVISSKSQGVLSQIAVLNAKLKTANIHKIRTENLIRDKAGTQKQLDDVQGEIDVLKQQVRSVEIQNAPVVNELKNLDVQLKQIDNQIDKCKIINPINGTVLTKYAEPSEITAFGKPLYKIAALENMELRVFISETQLANLKIGESVTVKIDSNDTMKDYEGTVIWIASEAEFTPKIIQTKEERIALVYAVKITVKNDGSLKIGMPAEMWLNNSNNNQ
ncbi:MULTISPECIES: HlyD family secretion protein [Bizionia]|uniref:HlyD family efflux transporter periplasmic adaptor subunit n=1 Tax=Bizionia algoritergicola TaxID=291187 RepID=A0A5D0QXY2_9FLAO|nr:MULTISPECIES: HlyD family efflux transporter periplasmic adaptor subunit [Bizionia]OBX24056.1 ABC transporter [Bizionia sp. APA-3]TYB73566.1 HlyD family efflux transporter periplasmic adaptor subunit [Bizionia algoritergicola]